MAFLFKKRSGTVVGKKNSMKNTIRPILFVIATFFTVRYFVWRICCSANPEALWFFTIFLTAEIFAFIETAFFYFTAWKPTHRKLPRPLRNHRTVDVFITTYDEPIHIVRETALCAVAMRYPHKTYILDDGNRPEMQKLASELKCDYISRTSRAHAKAGNLNNALFGDTAGEFIVLLDADHVPAPNMINDMMGFFADEKVAIVQAPQDFYNLDSFQHKTDRKKQYAWQQQELFFAVIQPGKDYWNAALFCGSPAVARRASLEAIGGFAVGTVTEDFHTSIKLQAKGYQTLYFNRTVARGLAPQTFEFFAGQWLRWGQGAMQILRRENPIFRRGLTLAQKISYFSSVYFYWMSYPKLILVFTPIFALLTGIFPLYAEFSDFWIYFGPYLVLNVAASAWIQRGFRGLLLTEQFTLIKLHIMMESVLGFLKKHPKFKITPKTQGEASRVLRVWLQGAIVVLTSLAIIVGFIKLPGASGFRQWAIAVCIFWSFYFLSITFPVVRRALKKREARMAYRFGGRVDVPILFSNLRLNPSNKVESFARNLNRHGLSITREYAIPVGTSIELQIKLPHYEFTALGKVVRNDKFKLRKKGIRVMNGVQFEKISPEAQDEISKYLFSEIAPQQGRLMRLTTAIQTEETPETVIQTEETPESAM